MALKIYNTLSGKKEEFKPIKDNKVNIFVCGPTVYDYSHSGHAKTYIQFDFIVKYLRYKGYKVFYLQNITDIDDKIINQANKENTPWKEISDKYKKEYLQDIKALGIDSVSKYANATDYISEIISQVKRLIDKGIAYKISDGYYFDLTKFKDYGKLAKRKFLKKDDSISRIDENPEKRNSGDFCLWKFKKENEPFWKSNLLGDGRPGWHIEDTAITEKEFGPQYDIHGGGIDLIFPHHEAEIAQMESISGKEPLVRYWMHTGFLKIDKQKMSKSLGNFMTIKDLLKEYSTGEIRYFFALTHYRKPLEFSDKSLKNSKNSYLKLKNICNQIEDDGKINQKYITDFEKSMDDDFNTPKAIQVLWNLLRDNSASGKFQTIKKIDQVFNFGLLEKEHIKIPDRIKKLVEEREKARKNKDWARADELRKLINDEGFSIDDTEKGNIIKPISKK